MPDIFATGGAYSSAGSTGSTNSISTVNSINSTSAGACDTSNALSGVNCDVTSCRYHNPGNKCCASSITVETPEAHCKDDTFCATYTPNSGC